MLNWMPIGHASTRCSAFGFGLKMKNARSNGAMWIVEMGNLRARTKQLQFAAWCWDDDGDGGGGFLQRS